MDGGEHSRFFETYLNVVWSRNLLIQLIVTGLVGSKNHNVSWLSRCNKCAILSNYFTVMRSWCWTQHELCDRTNTCISLAFAVSLLFSFKPSCWFMLRLFFHISSPPVNRVTFNLVIQAVAASVSWEWSCERVLVDQRSFLPLVEVMAVGNPPTHHRAAACRFNWSAFLAVAWSFSLALWRTRVSNRSAANRTTSKLCCLTRLLHFHVTSGKQTARTSWDLDATSAWNVCVRGGVQIVSPDVHESAVSANTVCYRIKHRIRLSQDLQVSGNKSYELPDLPTRKRPVSRHR